MSDFLGKLVYFKQLNFINTMHKKNINKICNMIGNLPANIICQRAADEAPIFTIKVY